MTSRLNDTAEPITVAYCTDPDHQPDCAGDTTHTILPGGIFTYSTAEDNGPSITAQLTATTGVTP